jgi:signal peptidase II
MKLARRALLMVFVLFACVGCDQLTKSIARQSLAASEPIMFLNDFFRLQYVENRGAFLSLGANTSEHLNYWIFVVFVGVALTGMLVYLMTSKSLSRAQSIALSLVLAGGVGNLIDRILNEGRVVDFMNMGIGSLRTGIFNVADVAITVGGLWLLVDAIGRSQKERGQRINIA